MSTADSSAGNSPDRASTDIGTLAIRFQFPSGGFLYRATSPRLHVDGRDVEVSGWDTCETALAAGGHRVHVWVPYVMPRKVGRAHADVTIRPNQKVELEYMAPSVTFLGGSLGPPGQQKSKRWRPVMVFNVVAVTLALLMLATRFL